MLNHLPVVIGLAVICGAIGGAATATLAALLLWLFARLAEAERRLANQEKANGPLFSNSLMDMQAQALQAARLLLVVERDAADARKLLAPDLTDLMAARDARANLRGQDRNPRKGRKD